MEKININIPSDSALSGNNKNQVFKDLYWLLYGVNANVENVVNEIGLLIDECKEQKDELFQLKKVVGDMGGNVTYEVPIEDKTLSSMFALNGTLKMTEDIVYNSNIAGTVLAANKFTLNLNGKKLTFTGNRVATHGGILLKGKQEMTVTGSTGTLECTETAPLIWTSTADNVVTIKSGNFIGNSPTAELIYCEKGNINITGGVFKNGGSPYLLNCKDANYNAGTAKIIVTGGKFYDFDPGNNTAEGSGTSFLAEGYTTVASQDGNSTVYTVKKA